MKINIANNFANVIKSIDKNYRKQVAFASSKALNEVAKIVKKEVIKEMESKLDRPTPYTLKSVLINYSDRRENKFTAEIYIRDRASSKNAQSPADQLVQQFSGGTRIRTRFENLLTKIGYISSNEYMAPGEGAQLDMFGNVSRGQIQKILSQIRAGSDYKTYKSNSSRSRAKRAETGYFWSHGGKLKRGVYQRFNFKLGSAVKPIMIVVSRPVYKRRINLQPIGENALQKHFNQQFKVAFDNAIRTAR